MSRGRQTARSGQVQAEKSGSHGLVKGDQGYESDHGLDKGDKGKARGHGLNKWKHEEAGRLGLDKGGKESGVNGLDKR